ncbi:serine protease [Pseudomonas sp. 21LCFQ010]|uniref:trypsin-like serine peptidase n=1 Tax=Pseudomonas sp. 21LCFQ010 TaxID=2957506 RepID=UPI00209708E4|nr:serine protease [Pseudomonas sp. 21LCFQ010]MCO8165460.1 serine protease [Pseudomonas sp. 21LCFQ010]
MSIILRQGRPALAVRQGSFDIHALNDGSASALVHRLEQARTRLEQCLPAIGRIELQGNADDELAGTGWLVSKDIVVTNAHVADKFAMPYGNGFRFRSATSGSGRQSAAINFLAEAGNALTRKVAISEVLWIARDWKPDIAFLRLAQDSGIEPLLLAKEPPQTNTHVVAAGYPVRDAEVEDQQLMEQIFQELYTYKCLSPGMVSGFTGTVLHDCSTLRGNSGSPLLDLNSGEVVGLHFLGGPLDGSNQAIAASTIRNLLVQRGLL